MSEVAYFIIAPWVGGVIGCVIGFAICALLTAGREESDWWDAAHETARKANDDEGRRGK